MPKGKRGGNNNPTGKGGAKKGEVRNPKGRPKLGCSITELLRAEGDEVVIFKYEDIHGKPVEELMTKDQAIIKQLYARALAGDAGVAFQLFERKEPLKRVIEMQGSMVVKTEYHKKLDGMTADEMREELKKVEKVMKDVEADAK